MYGKNSIAGQMVASDGCIVKKIWYTLQGEGPYAGCPAIFVRFSGCNLRCYFCDTDFEGGEHYTLPDLATVLQEWALAYKCGFFVFTGGEPMLQDIITLAHQMQEAWSLHSKPISAPRPPLKIQVETAGTVWPKHELSDQVLATLIPKTLELVCSPKTPSIHPEVVRWCRHYKYIIIRDELDLADGLPIYATQPGLNSDRRLFRPCPYTLRFAGSQVWVQPCDPPPQEPHNTSVYDARFRANVRAAVASALQHGYRLSFQVHKAVGVD